MSGRGRPGCLGCLGPLLLIGIGLVALLVFGRGLLAPWSCFTGGSFHALPVWTGVATIPTRTGDYTLHLAIEPSMHETTRGRPAFEGWGVLVTPAREKHVLKLSGNFADLWVGLRPDRRQLTMTLNPAQRWNGAMPRPRLFLEGQWQGAELVVSDQSTLTGEFAADGRLRRSIADNPSPERRVLTLHLRRCGLLEHLRATWAPVR